MMQLGGGRVAVVVVVALCGILLAEAGSAQEGLEELDDVARVVIETPSLYKFCSGSSGSVQALLEADEITRSAYVDLGEMGWTGKWRKKSLSYLREWKRGAYFSHYRGYELQRGGDALKNYEVALQSFGNFRDGHKVTLQRICLVSNARAMERIATDTAAAGFDGSLVAEMALVFEFEVQKRGLEGRPTFIMEQVFASFPGRETLAVIANYPADPSMLTRFSIFGRTQCGIRAIQPSSQKSNTDEAGRYVVVFDGSQDYGSIPSDEEDVIQFKFIDCDDYAGGCDGECPAGFTCHTKNGKKFCLACGLFERVRGLPTECCKVSDATNQCTNSLSRAVPKCFVENPDSFGLINGGGMVLPASWPPSVCGNHRNFVRNGGGCELKDTFNRKGNKRCYFPKGRFF